MNFIGNQKLYADVVHRAWEDIAFKKELISNPIATIEKNFGVKLELPKDMTLVVRDQSDESVIFINIPHNEEVDTELTLDQLEVVSGGVIDPGDGSGCTGPVLPIKIGTGSFGILK